MRSLLPRRALSEASIQKYRPIWDVWVRYLAERQTTWENASQTQARDFLLQVTPRRPSDGDAPRQVSPVTQARYWKVLHAVYQHAMARDWLAQSPITAEAKVAHSEVRESLVFNRVDWADLLAQLPSAPADLAHWAEVRDRALLLLMMQCGLTVGELKALECGDLQELDSAAPQLQISGGARADQQRSLPLPDLSADALRAYRALRQQMPQDNPLLFVRQRGGALQSAYRQPALASKSIYVMTAAYVRGVLGGRYPQLAHAGPAALRNSCIVRWLDSGLPEAQVLRWAGLKDAQALQRLRPHVVPQPTAEAQMPVSCA